MDVSVTLRSAAWSVQIQLAAQGCGKHSHAVAAGDIAEPGRASWADTTYGHRGPVQMFLGKCMQLPLQLLRKLLL